MEDDHATSPRIRAAFWIMMLLMSALVCVALLEIGARRIGGASPANVDGTIGLPLTNLDRLLSDVGSVDSSAVVFIGDSFVETGELEGGWVGELAARSSRSIYSLGASAAAPGQYFEMYRRMREAGVAATAVIVLYLGNDLVDQRVWRFSQKDPSTYLQMRRQVLGDPSSDLFWPCFDTSRPDGLIAKRVRAYRNVVVKTKERLRSLVFGAVHWQEIARLQARLCLRSEVDRFVESVSGLPMFSRHHDALLADTLLSEFDAIESELRLLSQRDKSLHVVVVLDREENCARDTGLVKRFAQPLLDSLIASPEISVFNPNPAFSRSCFDRHPYLPDGHWSESGHRIFADTLAAFVGSLTF